MWQDTLFRGPVMPSLANCSQNIDEGCHIECYALVHKTKISYDSQFEMTRFVA